MQTGPLQDAYKFDLFVSYASMDNIPSQHEGWVDQLMTRLRFTIQERTGVEPRIWFEKQGTRTRRALWEAQGIKTRHAVWQVQGPGSQTQVDPFESQNAEALQGSALFMAILSPAYLASERCMREFADFVEFRGLERVLKVVRLPAERPLLPDLPEYAFFSVEEGEPRELVDQPYYAVLTKLAWQVKFLLTTLGKASPVEAPRQAEMEVFLCHSSGDKPAVRALWQRLKGDGFAPWLDEKELLPGQRWELEIRDAIDRAGAVIVCLSSGSINKEGYVQREIRLVLDKAAEIPDDAIFLIPARLEDCSVPRRLSELQWVNLFEDAGYARLLQALRMRATALESRQAH